VSKNTLNYRPTQPKKPQKPKQNPKHKHSEKDAKRRKNRLPDKNGISLSRIIPYQEYRK
jgi:hypothetical protein